MNAVLTIELELLEPALVATAEHLLQLHPSQIRWVSVRLSTEGDDGENESVAFEAQSDDSRIAIQNLVALARQAQPKGTAVQIWYQGRAERFTI